jgi:type I restriction enzyme S subunit
VTGQWPSVPLRAIYRRVEERDRADLPPLSVYRDLGVVPRKGRDDNNNKLSDDLSAYKVVRPGDLVLNKMKTWQGSIGVSDYEGIVSPAYFIGRRVADVYSRFMHHLLRSAPLIAEYGARSKGIRPSQWDLPWEEFVAIRVNVPPLATQRAIADYLDAETARIDALIEKKRRMIRLTTERFRSLISELTQYDQSARVRHLTSLRTSGPRGWAERVGESGAPFIRSANLRRQSIELNTDDLALVVAPDAKEARRSSVQAGDVLVGITGANTGWIGCVPASMAGGFVSQHVAILRPSAVEPEWLAYSLYSFRAQDQLLGGQYGGTKQQLGLDELAELRIGNPDRKEQSRRVELMERARRNSEDLLAQLQQQIDLLRERRQALITAAVTGELDIPVAA